MFQHSMLNGESIYTVEMLLQAIECKAWSTLIWYGILEVHLYFPCGVGY